MNLRLNCLAVAAVAALHLSASAQPLIGSAVVGGNENWNVVRLADASCQAVLKKDDDVRALPTSLKIPVLGLPQDVTLRFGDKPAQPMRKVSTTEIDNAAVILSGAEFNEALQSGRVRANVRVYAREPQYTDLDLSGLAGVLDSVRACAGAAAAAAPAGAGMAAGAVAAPVAAAGTAAAAAKPGSDWGAPLAGAAAAGAAAAPAAVKAGTPLEGNNLCPPVVVDRMRAAGLRDPQIVTICR